MTTSRRMPGPATEWRVGARRARTFQQPLDPLADRGIWCRSPAAVRGFSQVDETRRVWEGMGGLLLYYMLGSDPALWPAGERREGEFIAHDKGYYHSYYRGERAERNLSAIPAALSRGRGALSPVGP